MTRTVLGSAPLALGMLELGAFPPHILDLFSSRDFGQTSHAQPWRAAEQTSPLPDCGYVIYRTTHRAEPNTTFSHAIRYIEAYIKKGFLADPRGKERLGDGTPIKSGPNTCRQL